MDDAESQSIKDIQNLLEDQSQTASWRKYARLVLPHVGLVTVVCVYAMVGAWVFYAIESPHEDRLKVKGVQRIHQMRKDLTELVWERHEKKLGQLTRDEWISRVRQNLQLFNENLYRAYKDQYVRYGDVRLSRREPLGHDPRIKRHRSSKSRSEKGGKLWTASSSLFFAATTMATIGYGNIVPVTSYGRIACIVFALFGAPLAIITIGDLGKFLSECTIWLYRKIKERSRMLRYHIKNWSWRKQGVLSEVDQMSLSRNSGGMGTHSNMDMSEWDDLGKAEVPVLLVFAILLLYIAFGGVLFAILESWTYMDAFYYCFVSLTTIGFGDLVPDRHEYIVLMLIYLGVGLAVTTMCIDLVGIQYIQKIHYFGRKFKGTDILQILRRKRMLERRFAMGEGKEFIEYVIQVTQENRGFHPPSSRSIMPSMVKVADQFYSRGDEEEKLSLQSEKEVIMPWSIDDINVDTTPLTQLPLAQKAPTPEVISAKSLSPLPPPVSSRSMTPLTNSTISARDLMYEIWTARSRTQCDNSWAESGPDISIPCSISSTPSVQEREFLYNNFRSPAPSVMSFQFSFPLPSPDMQQIAEMSRNARRVTSCPSIIKQNRNTSTPAHSPTPVSSITSSVRRKWKSFRSSLYRASSIQFAYPPILLSLASRYNTADNPSQKPLLDKEFVLHVNSAQKSLSVDEANTFITSKLAVQCDVLDKLENGSESPRDPHADTFHRLLYFVDRPPLWSQPANLTVIMESPQSNEKALTTARPEVFRQKRMGIQPVWFYKRRSSLLSTIFGAVPEQQTSTSALNQPPIIVEEKKPRPILKRKKLERLARRTDPLHEVDWLNVSPRMALMGAVREDLPAFIGQVSESSQNEGESQESSRSSLTIPSPQNVSPRKH